MTKCCVPDCTSNLAAGDDSFCDYHPKVIEKAKAKSKQCDMSIPWIVVAINKVNNQMDRQYFGPFDSEDKANSFATKAQEFSFCAFSVRLEKPIID